MSGGRLSEMADEGADDFFEGRGDDRVFEIGQGFARIASGANLHVERNFAQEGNVQLLGFLTGATAAKNVVTLAAFLADEATHVLDHAENRDVDGAEHRDCPLS